MKFTRLIIYVKDVQRVTGKTERCARMLMHRIREHFNKPHHQFVSIDEFCTYTGLNDADVRKMLD